MTKRIFAMAVGVSLLVGLGACSGTDTAPTPEDSSGQARTTGLQLKSDALGNTDVGGMKFTVSQCSGGVVDTAQEDLEDMYLPGGIPALEGEPYDKDSQHIFADHYFLLAAGCYDVEIQPLTAKGKPSSDCDAAQKSGVQVEDGETTEVLLISQCKGPEKGGLDVIGSVNHPPEIDNVTFKPSKFLTQCRRDKKDVCVTVSDPDGDPLEFVWKSTSQGKGYATCSLKQTYKKKIDSTTTKVCAKIHTTSKGKYGWTLKAYDQAYNEKGKLVRIQKLLKQNLHGKCQADNTNCTSNDRINAWVYAGMSCQP